MRRRDFFGRVGSLAAVLAAPAIVQAKEPVPVFDALKPRTVTDEEEGTTWKEIQVQVPLRTDRYARTMDMFLANDPDGNGCHMITLTTLCADGGRDSDICLSVSREDIDTMIDTLVAMRDRARYERML